MPAQSPDTVRLPNYYQSDPKTLAANEWLPDQPPLENRGINVAQNVYPLTPSSYGPIPSLAAVSGVAALGSQVFGLYSFVDRSGADLLFTGTASKLYRYRTGDSAFLDVSQAATTYTATAFSPWSMTGYGNSIIATNGDDQPQVLNIDTSGGTFLNLASNAAPIGKYVATVRDFVMFANINEPTDGVNYPQRVHWSAIGDPANFPALGSDIAAELLSDAQDLNSSLGHINGLAAGLLNADVAIFMDFGIYSGLFVPAPAIFSFQPVSTGGAGCRAPRSIVTNKGLAYFLGADGFYSFDGVNIKPIGAQKIDKWFFSDSADGADPSFLYLTQGSADPTGRLIMWAYCGPSSGGTPNRLLIYNQILDRWSMARVSVNWLGRALTTGYSLEQLDAFGNLETLAFSLDSPVWQGGAPFLAAFDTNNQLSGFTGANLAAVIETNESQPVPGRRIRVTSARPLVDGGVPTIAIGSRNRFEDAVTYGSAVAMNTFGECVQRVDATYIRAKITVPAASTWTHCMGAQLSFSASTPR